MIERNRRYSPTYLRHRARQRRAWTLIAVGTGLLIATTITTLRIAFP